MKHRQGNDKYLDTESSSPTHKGSIFYHVRLSIGRAGLLPLRPTATMRRTSTRSFLIRVIEVVRGQKLEIRGDGGLVALANSQQLTANS